MKINRLYFLAIIVVSFIQNINAQQDIKISAVGAINKLKETNFEPKIWLDTLSNKSHLYGLGPYGRLQGEITIVDGKPFYVSAYKKGKAVIGKKWDMKSPFFVYANVRDWDEFNIPDSITSISDIQNIVSNLAKSKGYNTQNPFPFKIVGVLKNTTISIVTPRSDKVTGYRKNVKQQIFSYKDISGKIIGFYSEKHQGIFTSSKSFIHVHFINNDDTIMGHLEKINADKNSLKLLLPRISNKKQRAINVVDTDFSKGRVGLKHKITLDDLEKFHGHLCDGLVVGYLGIKEGLNVLYPDGVVDRTNTRIVSKSSPCLTDVAVYVTGGRYQFNSFYVDNSIKNGFYIIQRKDNGKSVEVSLNKGVRPAEIDKLGAKAIKGELPACDLEKLKKMEHDFSEKLLSTNPKDNFTVKEIKKFQWNPILKNNYIKTDILNKNKSKCNH
jgi:acetolactate decarboxylase